MKNHATKNLKNMNFNQKSHYKNLLKILKL